MASATRRTRAIIIGTGAGGLAAAAWLASRGVEVVALERARQLGGYLNPFKRKRFHFDPGVHYMGHCGPGDVLGELLDLVDLDARALFCPMADDFDLLRFPDLEVRVCAGFGPYRDRLAEAFPERRRDLDRYFGILRRFDRGMDALQRSFLRAPRPRDAGGLLGLPTLLRWSRSTYGDLLAHCTDDPRLRSVLAAQCGDYGLPPSQAPAWLGLALHSHFARGAFFPRRGSGALRDALVERAERDGAIFRRRADVTRIVVERGRAVGVELADGERIVADVVISAIDPRLTFGPLLDGVRLPRRVTAMVDRAESSAGSLCVFLGMRRDLRQHGLSAANVWDYPTWDIEALYASASGGQLPDPWSFFLSPNSLKDDSGSMAPAGCSTLEVVTLAPFEPFERWDGLRSLKRGAEYDAYKAEVADSLLGAVEDRWPGLIGDVAVREVATPVTNGYYTNAIRGAAYGPAALLDAFGPRGFQTWTPIGGLYLAGAAVLGPGVVPSLCSGAVAGRFALAGQTLRRVTGRGRREPLPPLVAPRRTPRRRVAAA